MSKAVKDLLSIRLSKTEFLKRIRTEQIGFDALLGVAINSPDSYGWRAAWLVGLLAKRNDERIVPSISDVLNVLMFKEDGHQREFIKLLLQMKMSEAQQSIFLDHCVNIWKSIDKKPGTRIFAYKFMINMCKKFPELSSELDFLSQEHYTDSLSPGIKKSFEKLDLL